MRKIEFEWDKSAAFAETKMFPAPKRADIGYLTAEDGADLRTAIFYPTGVARGTLVLMTGYAEYIEKYVRVAQTFTKQGFCVVLPEWRGHGRSTRISSEHVRLHLNDFDQNCSDLMMRIERLVLPHCPMPYVGLAHSMGGLIALRSVMKNPDIFEALALCAPMLGVQMSAAQQSIIKFIGSFYRLFGALDQYPPSDPPSRTAKNPAQNRVAFNDTLWQQYEVFLKAHPDLQVNGRSMGWVLTAIDAMRDSAKPDLLKPIHKPIFIASASDEKLVDNEQIRQALKHLPNAQGKEYAPAMHELLMENKEIYDAFIADLLAFFDRYIKG